MHFGLTYNAVIYAVVCFVILQCPFAFVFDFFPLINFTGYLPKMPIGEWGILPPVCCLREGIPWFSSHSLTSLQFLFCLYPRFEIVLTWEIFLNRKMEENMFLIHMYTRCTQMWMSDQKHLFHFPFWTSLIYKTEKKSCSTCSVSPIPRHAKQVTCPSLFRVKILWSSFLKTILIS